MGHHSMAKLCLQRTIFRDSTINKILIVFASLHLLSVFLQQNHNPVAVRGPVKVLVVSLRDHWSTLVAIESSC